MIIAILILTILDVLLTSAGIELGVISEANPILQNIFHLSPELASIIVIIFVTSFLIIISKCRYQYKWINNGVTFLLIVKVGVMFTHLHWILTIV